MKRILSLLVIFVFTSSIFVNTALAFDSYVTTDFDKSSFPDIYTYNPYFKSVEVLYKNGVVKGYSDGKYKPGKKLNRAEFIKIVMEVNEIKAEGENCFPDVKKEWFAKYVCAAKKQEIIKGYPNGKFHPEKNISFVEAAKIIVEASGGFIDKKYNKNWYHPYVKEFEDNVSIPLSIAGLTHEITRGEMADMIVDMSMSRMGYDSLTYEDLEKIGTFPVFDKKKKIFSYVFEKYYKNKLPVSGIPPAIDPSSFTAYKYAGSGVDLYRDNNNVYCYVEDSALMQIMGSDPHTFKTFIDSVFDDEDEYDYAADKNSIYGPNKDKNCFVKIDTITGGKKHFQKNIFTDVSDIYYYDLSSDKKGFIKIDGADPKTLKKNETLSSFDVNFYQDVNYLYLLNPSFLLTKISSVDIATLKHIVADIYSDKNSVYIVEKGAFTKQDNLDGKTFKWINHVFYSDKNGVYILEKGAFTKQDNLDGKTFEEIYYAIYNDKAIFADKNGVYIYNGKVINKQNIDVSTFKYIDENVFSDKNGVYIEVDGAFKKQNITDIATFEVVYKGSVFFKDKVNVYSYNIDSDLLEKLPDGDTATFKFIIAEDEMAAFTKDKDTVWFYNPESEKFEKQNEADASTIKFTVYKDENYIQDKNSVWKVDSDTEKITKIKGADPATYFAE